jgi:HD-like signal output (HDOD) protein
VKRILFVDDELNILTGLRRSLRSVRHEWEMVFAQGGAAALEECARTSFDVVISDARMPGMQGFEFLDEVRRLHPDAVRMILSGQCSQTSVLKCVAVAHQFLSKPCDAATVKAAVQKVCDARDVFHGPDRSAIASLQWLPSPADAYGQLAAQLESEKASLKKVSEIIASDVAMSAKVVHLVSSGFFGTPQRVAGAAQAATLLGLETLKALLASPAAFAPSLAETAEDDLHRLTEHSLAVATAAQRIAGTMTNQGLLVGDSYLSGLLHELGTLALGRRGRLRASTSVGAGGIGEKADRRGGEAGSAERNLDPGGYLAALWGLPSPVVQAIAYHRLPGLCPERVFGPLTAVHVANALLEPRDGSPEEGVCGVDLEYLEQIGCGRHLEDWREICAECQPGGVLV